MSAITAAAHQRLVLLRRAYDASEGFAVMQEAGNRYRDAVTVLALQTGQAYEDIDAGVRAEALIENGALYDTTKPDELCDPCWGCRGAEREAGR